MRAWFCSRDLARLPCGPHLLSRLLRRAYLWLNVWPHGLSSMTSAKTVWTLHSQTRESSIKNLDLSFFKYLTAKFAHFNVILSPSRGCPCWFDITMNCACCKNDGVQCGYPMHNYCWPKTKFIKRGRDYSKLGMGCFDKKGNGTRNSGLGVAR